MNEPIQNVFKCSSILFHIIASFYQIARALFDSFVGYCSLCSIMYEKKMNYMMKKISNKFSVRIFIGIVCKAHQLRKPK